jgi:hypothetical protein
MLAFAQKGDPAREPVAIGQALQISGLSVVCDGENVMDAVLNLRRTYFLDTCPEHLCKGTIHIAAPEYGLRGPRLMSRKNLACSQKP